MRNDANRKRKPGNRRGLWLVKVAYHYGYEAYRDALETDVRLCASKREAVAELERIIREDWTTEVKVGGEVKSLADCRGMSANSESVKFSEWHYSEDGTLAWAFFSDDHGYKGEVVKVEALP